MYTFVLRHHPYSICIPWSMTRSSYSTSTTLMRSSSEVWVVLKMMVLDRIVGLVNILFIHFGFGFGS